jgi:hypothetical protein
MHTLAKKSLTEIKRFTMKSTRVTPCLVKYPIPCAEVPTQAYRTAVIKHTIMITPFSFGEKRLIKSEGIREVLLTSTFGSRELI